MPYQRREGDGARVRVVSGRGDRDALVRSGRLVCAIRRVADLERAVLVVLDRGRGCVEVLLAFSIACPDPRHFVAAVRSGRDIIVKGRRDMLRMALRVIAGIRQAELIPAEGHGCVPSKDVILFLRHAHSRVDGRASVRSLQLDRGVGVGLRVVRVRPALPAVRGACLAILGELRRGCLSGSLIVRPGEGRRVRPVRGRDGMSALERPIGSKLHDRLQGRRPVAVLYGVAVRACAACVRDLKRALSDLGVVLR